MSLRSIVLSAFALAGCATQPIRVPEQQAQQTIEYIVEDATTYIIMDDTARAQGLFEQHLEQKKKTRPDYELTPSGKLLLSLIHYSNNWYEKAQTDLIEVFQEFEKDPTIIYTMREELKELMQTPYYENIKTDMWAYAKSYIGLYPVYGLLNTIEGNWHEAAQGFSKTVPYLPTKSVQYKLLFEILALKEPEARIVKDAISNASIKRKE